MARFPDWHGRLSDHIQGARGKRFAWGEHDCALWAFGAIQAMTGLDLGARFRGKYKSEAGAARLMRRFAGGGLLELAEKLAEEFGFAVWDTPLKAQRGDLVLVPTERGPALGIVALHGICVWCVGRKGLATLPLASCLRAWRVS